MEDRRTALAILLCILVVIAYTEAFVSPYTRQAAQQSVQSNQVSNPTSVAPTPGAAPQQNQAQFVPAGTANPLAPAANTAPRLADYQESDKTVIQSDSLQITVSHLGGRILSYKLRDYKTSLESAEPLELVKLREDTSPPLGVTIGAVTDDAVQYSLTGRSGSSFNVSGKDSLEIDFQGVLPGGVPITKTLKVSGEGYLFETKVKLGVRSAERLWLSWPEFAPGNDDSSYDAKNILYLSDEKDLERVASKSIEENYTDINAEWLGFGNKYFTTTLLPKAEGHNGRFRRNKDLFVLQAAGTLEGGSFELYVGPKERAALTAAGYELSRSIDLGFFTPLAVLLIIPLNIFYGWLGNYGLAIILLTLCIKALFLPLTQKSLESMKAMQDLQPEMKAMRERIKEPTELNKEMMALYKRKGVNPMGGCFPMLIQLPVFLGLYNGLLNSIELRHAPFALWIQDLASPERLELFGIGVPVMILLMGVAMMVQQYTTPSAMDPAQKKAMMMMPFVFTIMFIIFPFPAGLVLYWLTNTLISIVQQAYLRGQRKGSPLQATAVASVGIFILGFILTKV